jgi:glycosyltransferase involved in cell wall biosynthesis
MKPGLPPPKRPLRKRADPHPMAKVLVVGQTPPPYGGQAIMIEEILRIRRPGLELFHVRMDFSDDMDDMGKVKLKKVTRLVGLIAKIIRQRLATGADILYFPPAGPNRVPVIRDLAILLAVRWMFRKTVFHFHAGGLSEICPNLPSPIRWLVKWAYGKPDATIRLSELNPEDGRFLQSRCEYVIPYGIPDPASSTDVPERGNKAQPVILYVAVLCESKGLLVLLDACGLLRKRGVEFSLEVMGRFESKEFERRALESIERQGLAGRVRFLGVQTGQTKFRSYAGADIFCFPTFFESETFGVVLLEAMAFSLPLVATRWRGIPSIVKDGETGYLTPIKDAGSVAEKLEPLLRDSDLRAAMGRKGRAQFEREFRLEAFQERMAQVFSDL